MRKVIEMIKKTYFALALTLCLSAGALAEESPAVHLLLPEAPISETSAPETPSPQATATPEPQTLQTAKEANLRKLPTVKSDLLERVKPCARVEVISQSEVAGETWVHVRVGRSKREGYMLLSLLEPIPTPTPAPTATPEPTPTPVPTPTA